MHRLIISICFLSAIASAYCARPVRHYHTTSDIMGDTLIIYPDTIGNRLSKAIEICAGQPSTKSSKKAVKTAFGVVWGVRSENDYHYALLCTAPTDDDIIDNAHATLIIGHHRADGSDTVRQSLRLTKGFDLQKGENTLAAEIDCRTSTVRVIGGEKELEMLYESDIDSADADAPVGILTIGSPSISLIVSETMQDPASIVATKWTCESIRDHLSNSDRLLPAEGIWRYLDRANDNDYARQGGDYTLALVADSVGSGYDIIYLGGATVNSDQWHPGMKKGHLEPTRFAGHYNLIWFDSQMTPYTTEASATFEGSSIVRLDFPLLKTSIRFSKDN